MELQRGWLEIQGWTRAVRVSHAICYLTLLFRAVNSVVNSRYTGRWQIRLALEAIVYGP